MEWQECEGNGLYECDGTIDCVCEGMGGTDVCPLGCDV